MTSGGQSSIESTGVGSRGFLVIGLLCSAQFLDIVSLSSVNVALPAISAGLAFQKNALQWVISAYALTFAGFLLLGGRLADVVGRRRVMLGGFALFGAGALACALAPSPVLLIAARAVQGVGAALTIPAAIAILSSTFTDPAERSRALAAFAAAGAVGFAAGLVLGGLITDSLGWRWIFALNVPVVALLAAAALGILPSDARSSGDDETIDVIGAVSGTGGLLLLAFGLSRAGEDGGLRAPESWGSLLAAVCLLAMFLRHQARTSAPLMPLRVWTVPNFAPVMLVTLLFYAAWTGATYYVALTLEQVLSYSPFQASLAMLPYAIGGYVASTLAGRLLPRVGPKPLLIGGLLLYGAGIAITSAIGPGTAYWPLIALALSVTVCGLGPTFVAANVAALAAADAAEHGLVGGLFNTGLQVGGGIGLAILSVVAAHFLPADSPHDPAALMPAYRAALLGAAGFVALALAAAMFLVKHHPVATGQSDLPASGIA